MMLNTTPFTCPICRQVLNQTKQGLTCPTGHHFDRAKEGYINLMQNTKPSRYTRALFQARRRINEQSHLFLPLLQEITALLKIESHNDKPKRLLDGGAGDGYLLAQVYQELKPDISQAIGLDIAKEGIRLASKSYPDIDWLVADLAKIPLQAQSVDILLNILSPSNYDEFQRVLKPHGWLLKVIPEKYYLQEIRQSIYQTHPKKDYTNQAVISLFKESFHLIQEKTLHYQLQLNPKEMVDLLNMTPLTWHLSQADKDKLSNSISTITMHFTLLLGQAHKKSTS